MPDWKNIIRDRMASLRLEGAAELDLAEELAQHLEDCYREALSGGATPEEAYRNAMGELDDTYPLRADLKRSQRMGKYPPVPAGDARPGNFMEDLWRDVRYALRTMGKSPLFVLFVVLTLALGIGANTTVFTVINTLILNPLPVPDSSRLAAVGEAKAQSAKSSALLPMSYADLKDYQARNGVFRSLAGYTSPRGVTLQVGRASQGMFSELVTGNYFSTLGLSPGSRTFLSARRGQRSWRARGRSH